MAMRTLFLALLGFCLPGSATANGLALFSGATPLLASAPSASSATSGSLFTGTTEGSLFAPLPPRTTPHRYTPGPLARGSVAQLLSLISEAESGRDGYDAINGGARIRTPRPPSRMTLGEIYDWISATPGQPHAIGRYQFIPPTLRRVAAHLGLGDETRFDAAVQDALALVLLEEAGLAGFTDGTLDRRTFMHNLARIWAGLPLPNGRSYYEGYAGNRATMTWARFESGMDRIWPAG